VPTNRLQFNLSGLWTPTTQTGVTTLHTPRRRQANQTTASKGNLESRRDPRLGNPQWNMAYTGDYIATTTTLVSVRGGYFKDNYFDTGVNKSQTFEYATSAVGVPGVPAQYAQPAGYSNLPRTQIKDHDITTRNFVDLAISQTVNKAGVHQFKGGFGYSRATNDVNLAYPERRVRHAVLGSDVRQRRSRVWVRARAPTATTRSTTSARRARPAPTS
jgi:hypothetical protein